MGRQKNQLFSFPLAWVLLVAACGPDDAGQGPLTDTIAPVDGSTTADDTTPGTSQDSQDTPTGCTPGELLGCEGPYVVRCSPAGVAAATPCPAGQACSGSAAEAACEPLAPNVVLVVDTSSSMNYVPALGTQAHRCEGEDCPPWDFPRCDWPPEPLTRLGAAKRTLLDLLDTPELSRMNLALQRFPSRPRGRDEPTCSSGYSFTTADEPGAPTVMDGDDGSHQTDADGWFTESLEQVVVVPFGETPGANLDEIRRWVDFAEALGEPGTACVDDTACGKGVCVGGSCHEVVDPELRGIGFTPLGKSLFYAGEYLRHTALASSRACQGDSDCATSHELCREGACVDPVRHCRTNAIILFTDGAESDHRATTDFFHPRVQAKRLHFGLGCASDGDCLAGASCADGHCQPPEGAIPTAEGNICSAGELPCEADADCPSPCSTWSCPSYCLSAEVAYADPEGHDVLRDASGRPTSVRVHLIDTSGVEGANRYIAAYGGGRHFSVGAVDTAGLLQALQLIVTDVKRGEVCHPL